MFDDPSLLVVDDEKSICEVCQRIFSRQGFHVDKSTDAQEGLRRAVKCDYSGVLLDIKMPGIDGIGFLKVLRKTKPDVPVVLITGYPSISYATEAIRLGASDFVTKPFTPDEITRAVHRSIAHGGPIKEKRSSATLARPESWEASSDEFQFWNESWLQVGTDCLATITSRDDYNLGIDVSLTDQPRPLCSKSSQHKGKQQLGPKHYDTSVIVADVNSNCRSTTDKSVRVGVVLAPLQQMATERIRLPGIGETVYQGLPLAGLVSADKVVAAVPSPITGTIVAVNEPLEKDLEGLFGDPCGKGWIAQISPTAFAEDVRNCRIRRVVLANADEASAREQLRHLNRLGCQIRLARSWEEMAPIIGDDNWDVVLLDDASFGGQGPRLAERINQAALSNLSLPKESDSGLLPKTIVVVASNDCQSEAAYREQQVFYYAIEPFADNEIAMILDAAFRSCPWDSCTRTQRHDNPSNLVSSICTTNWNGKEVCLLVECGLASKDDGFGWYVRHKLLDQLRPVRTRSEEGSMTPIRILEAAGKCDRLLVLVVRHTGRLPGSLTREVNEEFSWAAGDRSGKVTTLVVQPVTPGGGLSELEDRTAQALAEQIVREMSSCA